jgi:septum formation protein
MPSPLILASTSKYRRELLERLAIPFTCQSPGIDEEAWKRKGLPAAELARELAIAKSQAVWSKHPDAIVIGSDQVAEVDGQILDKPGSINRAIEQLGLLSGKTHHLWTAVAISSVAGCDVFIDKTTLTMRSLTAEEMARYVAHDQPLDCAGSYKLESLGITLFEQITSADQTAIIGLPLLETARRLREHGFQLP